MGVYVEHDDGREPENITELAKLVYDLAVGSMNWGSGMMGAEEVAEVRRFAYALRLPMPPYEGDKCTCEHKRDWHREAWQEHPGRCGGVAGHGLSWHRGEQSPGLRVCPCERFEFADVELRSWDEQAAP